MLPSMYRRTALRLRALIASSRLCSYAIVARRAACIAHLRVAGELHLNRALIIYMLESAERGGNRRNSQTPGGRVC